MNHRSTDLVYIFGFKVNWYEIHISAGTIGKCVMVWRELDCYV